MTPSEPIACLFCGKEHTYRDTAWTETRGEDTLGWHPGCWPSGARNMSDLLLRRTPDGIRGRLRAERYDKDQA